MPKLESRGWQGISGSVELVSFEDAGPDAQGLNLAGRASPGGLGLNLLRFPVHDLESYAAWLASQGIMPEGPGIITTDLPPGGECKLMAIRAPDGAWLEFCQPIQE